MMKKYFLFLILLNIKIFSQHVDAGDDMIICHDQLSVLLHAKTNFSSEILTSRYKVEAIPFQWNIDLTDAKVVKNTVGLPLLEDDTYSAVINLPFPFSFFEKTYQIVLIGGNGDLIFDRDIVTYTDNYKLYPTQTIPNHTLPYWSSSNSLSYASIMGAFYDMDISKANPNKKLLYKVEGTAPNRKFIVMYIDVPLHTCNSKLANQMIVLNEADNSIEVHVKTKPICNSWYYGVLAVLGIQNEQLSSNTCGNYPGDATSLSLPNRNTGVWIVEETTPEAYKFIPDINLTYTWIDENGNILGKGVDIDVYPTKDTEYTLEVSYEDCHGNTYKEYDTVTVHVLPEQELELKEQEIFCEEEAKILNGRLSNESDFNTVSYTWTDPNGNIISHDAVLKVDSAGVYTLTVETENTCSKTYPIKVRIYEGCKIPEGISPNGDGLNDAFVLDYYAGEVGIETFQVFDRKGVLVYEKHNYVKEFVGKDNNGNELPSATYYYVFQLKNGEKHTGWFQLIR